MRRIVASNDGTLLGRISLVNITDTKPTLSFRICIPVLLNEEEATLSVDLRYPKVRSWKELIARSYRFDESTRRTEVCDGQVCIIDDVFGDIRTKTNYYDTMITYISFDKRDGEYFPVVIGGSIHLKAESVMPFTIGARVHIGDVLLDGDLKNTLDEQLIEGDYYPIQVIDGVKIFKPKFTEGITE